MAYIVKEIFYTIQGEGVHTGRPAVFCRFSGCNLWSGREVDRATAVCQFCDTDFLGTGGQGGGRFESAVALVEALDKAWGRRPSSRKFVVFTGGEPLLQLDEAVTNVAHEHGYCIAVETNGTVAVPSGVDHVCVSPKAGAGLIIDRGNELKIVFPQAGLDPAHFAELGFEHFFLQPMDGPEQARNLELTVAYCQDNPLWRLSLQTHKLIGLP
jgi:7-carboxy-7-deazaguanine synthase